MFSTFFNLKLKSQTVCGIYVYYTKDITCAYLVAVAVVGRVAVDFGLRLPVAPAPAAVVVEAELRQRLGRHRGRHLHQLGRRHHRHQLETSEENQS